MESSPGQTELCPLQYPWSFRVREFLPGRDPKSFYINTGGSRYRGVHKDGAIAEISGDEVDSCSL